MDVALASLIYVYPSHIRMTPRARRNSRVMIAMSIDESRSQTVQAGRGGVPCLQCGSQSRCHSTFQISINVPRKDFGKNCQLIFITKCSSGTVELWS